MEGSENSEMQMKCFFVSLDGEHAPCSGDQYSTVTLYWNRIKGGGREGREEGRKKDWRDRF